MNEQRYTPIPPGAIIPGTLPEFKIYIVSDQGRYVLWAREGNRVTSDQLDKLASSHTEVFLDLDEELKYEEYLETNLAKILENPAPSDKQKTSIFTRVSANVVKEAFETSLGLGSMDDRAMQRAQTMVKNALTFIAQSKSLDALTAMIGHDYKTYEHAMKVLWFTTAFLKDNPTVMEQIEPGYQMFDAYQRIEALRQCGVGALLHDIGKAFVSPDILNKEGPLSDLEWEVMKRHPLSGLAMLLDSNVPAFARKAVLHHHEDFHGGGYPMGLQGQTISTLARVVRIIDCFDAMTSRRPYKDPISALKAMQIMVGIAPDKQVADGRGYANQDKGMRHCFDEELLGRFVVFLGRMKLRG